MFAAVSLFPAETEARSWSTLSEVAAFAGVATPMIQAVEEVVGELEDSVRNLALLPAPVIRSAVAEARIGEGEREFTPIQAAKMGLTWRIARRLMTATSEGWMGFADVDPMADEQEQMTSPSGPETLALMDGEVNGSSNAVGSPSTNAPALAVRKLKMSSYIDQTDDSEFLPAPRKTVEKWYANFVAFAQGPPNDAEEPTGDQLQAVYHKVKQMLAAPYVDFAIFGPFNRKVVRAMKFVAWVPTGDGSFLRKEIPGPENISALMVPWKVFRVTALMLQIIAEMALQRYRENMERLAGLWPEAWHLIYLADDKMRAEGLEKYRRKIEAGISAGRPAPPLWDASEPWSACFLMAADDRTYWDEQVKDVALSWVARGAQGAPLSPDEIFASRGMREIGGVRALHPPQTETGLDFGRGEFSGTGPKRAPGQGVSKTAKRRRRDQELISSFKTSQGGSRGSGNNRGGGGKGRGKSSKGKGKGKLHSKDDRGREICYSYNNRKGSCAGDGACPNGRSHICSICKGNHRMVECTS